MKKTKLALVMIMVLALSMSALFGCSTSAPAATEATEAPAVATEAPAEAAATEAPAKDGFVIVGLYKMGTAEWFQQEGEASRKIIEAAGGTFKYMDCETDGAKFMEMLDTCIADKVDGVLTCIPDQNLSKAAVDKLTEAGIPVIACDDALEDENGNKLAPWVGIDAYNIGAGIGEWAAQYIKDNNLADDASFGIMLMTADTVSSCVPRTEGQIAKLTELLPGIDAKIYRADHDTNMETGNVAASAVITGNPQITKWLVLAVSDEGAVGAARALEAAGLAADSMCVGLGGYYCPEEFANPTSPFRAAAYFSARGVGGAAAQEMLDFLQNGTAIPEKTAVGATIVKYGDDLATIMPEYAG
ncbi:MAG: substrate-binding domain-containing protein [Clostridiaceae bacterium]